MLPSVILTNPKYSHNLAAAIRACACFDAKTLFWTGDRIQLDGIKRLPREERMKGYSKVTWVNTNRPFDMLPVETIVPVCVELMQHSEPLTFYEHPENAVYIFGPEDGGVSQAWRALCHRFVHIPARHCLNLAAAVNVVLADRHMKKHRRGLVLDELYEHRGVIEVSGWDGK